MPRAPRISSSPFSSLTLVDLESLCPTLNPRWYQHGLFQGWREGLGKELLNDPQTGNWEYPFFLILLLLKATGTFPLTRLHGLDGLVFSVHCGHLSLSVTLHLSLMKFIHW